ncbi:MAG: twin-arginine translocase TatA/TatE family subunit [Muribaculaceae bacterium]|nr:twin-arginine translocase TatA/TatE family subunit [Muribaculaceae bacterium]
MNILTISSLPLFLGGLRGSEWVIIAIVVLLLFGAKRIPQLMRNVGKGIRGFKEGMNDMRAEINKPIDKKDDEKVDEPKTDESKKD